MLNSSGGNLYAAYKIMNLIRNKCSSLIVIIPEYANSAASLMSLAGDFIIMGQQSELGPLDKPIEHLILEGKGRFSALDGARPFENLYYAIRNLALELAEDLRMDWRLSREIALDLAFKIATNYVNSTIEKMDPFILNMCNRWLQVTRKYATEFLTHYMFNEWEPEEIKQIGGVKFKKDEFLNKISWTMTYSYPEHSFAISLREAKEIGLKVIPAENFKQWAPLWKIYLKFKDEDKKIIRLLKPKK